MGLRICVSNKFPGDAGTTVGRGREAHGDYECRYRWAPRFAPRKFHELLS